MAIQNLVGIAIDEGEKTSNKLKALELIGKMSEVALFTDRKELIHTNNSADIKTQLLEGLRQAFSNSRQLNDLAKRKAESLLIELEDARTISDDEQTPTPFEIDEPSDPPTHDPQNSTHFDIEGLHSNPLKRTDAHMKAASLLADLTPPADEVTISLESDTCVSIRDYPDALEDDSEGVGVLNPGQSAPEVLQETPPVNISNKKG
jgi:hypothetical protein